MDLRLLEGLPLAGLDGSWNFFSPIGGSNQFRYVIEDADGNEHTFTPITEISWFTPTHRWSERIFEEFMLDPDSYADYFTKLFCRKHAALRPVAISFVNIEQKDFGPEDHLLGKVRTRDPEYYTANTLLRADCPKD